MSESALDRHDRLDNVAPADMDLDDLITECRDYLESYEEPNSYFSGDNRMAALVTEALRRLAP